MTKAILEELVYLSLSGGETSMESSVQRVDISAYLPVAYSSAMVEYYWMLSKQRRGGDRQPLGDMYYSDIEATITKTGNIGKLDGVTLLAGYHPLGHVIIDGVKAVVANNCFTAKDLSGIYDTQVAYTEGQQVYVVNPCGDTAKVRGIFNLNTFDREETITLPPSVEESIIERCVKHFSVQKRLIENEVDNNDDGVSQSDR